MIGTVILSPLALRIVLLYLNHCLVSQVLLVFSLEPMSLIAADGCLKCAGNHQRRKICGTLVEILKFLKGLLISLDTVYYSLQIKGFGLEKICQLISASW